MRRRPSNVSRLQSRSVPREFSTAPTVEAAETRFAEFAGEWE
jgi:hypothetical protein